ncbi:bifunctional phosphopantothenoylcysteine decarboxylase/phosphopantothenate--cysteine ligase CoaBC [Trichlorobacter ammonificans]|uniref:Coenzyme A biosynthesis bifunctional protein CoaBC n=1 Tax=Trichlorobacter ammonificans TaxID=2916410 RepID=A0ABM9DBK6_9BACT|nr:bifunctional phosphopantothenoylcysteine decarboxylase/phosphopantothenate--cysteine ligase CoaBC [Trichlorobacter ammonificans]CAH2032619.1 Phosphopantothenoylcysteine decarboxylase / Phosphopantothenate--cysteine ligase [Trichlorobacter ammonificans]
MNLDGKTIVLGVSGGIAVYKAVELLRLFTKGGATVHVVMTRSAMEFVTPLTFQTLSGTPVHTELFALYREQEIGHISLADRADLLVIAPATANIIGKIASGIADDLLTTTVMATKAPVLLAPAMNVNMYSNPIYQQNEARLRELGYRFVDAETGDLACGWSGSGRLASPATIAEEACRLVTPPDLSAETILITAGPTREELDPVRYLTNHSSGRMGYELARAARNRGARVVLVSGPTDLPPPAGVSLFRVTTAQQMRDTVLEQVASCSIVIKAAAVADYRPMLRSGEKLKKHEHRLTIELEKNPDILAELGALQNRPFLVGFAAETTDLRTHALAKLQAKNLDMIVANDVSQVGAGFNVATNIVRLIRRDGHEEQLELMSKELLAHIILDRIQESRQRAV